MMKNRKDGVAVIIVLGLLALLMVLGIAFTVTMRIERAGAGNFASAVATRQIAWAGIARAIDAINQSVSTNMFPDGDFRVSGTTQWNTWIDSGNVALLTHQVRGYVPDALLAFIDAEGNPLLSSWLPVGPDGDDPDGHVAYLILNLSDMLDANYAGGLPRLAGMDPGELVLDHLLTEEDVVAVRAQLPYLSLPALRKKNGSLPIDYFVTDSRFVSDHFSDVERRDISGIVDDLMVNPKLRELRFGLIALLNDAYPGISDDVRGVIRQNAQRQIPRMLLQYLANEEAAANTDGPNLKLTPLLNEVYYSADNLRFDRWRLLFPLRIETWYPYALGTIPKVAIDGSMVVELTVDSDPPYQVTVTNETAFPIEIDAAPPALYAWEQRVRIDFAGYPILTNDRPFQLRVRLENLRVVLDGSPTELDTTGDTVFTFQTVAGSTLDVDGTAAAITLTPRTYEVQDPRLNWRQDYWIASDTDPTPAAINRATQLLWAARPHLQHGYPLYVSNAGQLFSPLELGNLPAPDPDAQLANGNLIPGDFSPWHSFRVFDRYDGSGTVVAPRHRILEHFTVNTNEVRRGLVNVNTMDPDILRTAFDQIPGLFAEAGVTNAQEVTDAVVEMLINYREADPKNVHHYLSGMLEVDWRAHPILKNQPDIILNALASYSTGMLGVRQNLFLVVVSASAAGKGMAGDTSFIGHRGRRNALVLVWRDPVPNAVGIHENFIRYFRWLE